MDERAGFHDNVAHSDEVKVGSERSFGLVFTAVFLLIGLWPVVHALPIRSWALIAAAVFFICALAMPRVLRPFNLIWFRFGMLLHKIVNPLVMGLLFFSTITPIGLIFRIIGKDSLHRTFEPDADTYWIRRDPPGPTPDSMKNQF